jgi:mannitol-1-phosphate 5-dehydrogenase
MTAVPKTFVGFGFGAIQGGLFLYEAFRSGKFERLVVAEVVPDLVAAVRRAKGCYRVNVATRTGIEVREVRGVEIFNSTVPADERALAQALAAATEIATALPSVEFFQRGEPSVAGLIARAMQTKTARRDLPPCIVYTAENHNHAAEILQAKCDQALDAAARPAVRRSSQILNTVIGKMSGMVTDPDEIAVDGLARLVDDFPRALLVEEFNRILITRIELPGFRRGIEVFIEKPDLLPFEEAKLYGHNAVHALIGYLIQRRGHRFMSEAAGDLPLMAFAREAFLEESGAALVARHRGVDPRRKLAWEDRLIGTMRFALDAGITPRRFALGAAAALETLGSPKSAADQLQELWPAADEPSGRKAQLIRLITEAQAKLKTEQT